MIEFKQANQVRLELKMKLSVHSWYCGSVVVSDAGSGGYSVVIIVKKISDSIRKEVPQVLNNVSVKIEEQNRNRKRAVKKVMEIE